MVLGAGAFTFQYKVFWRLELGMGIEIHWVNNSVEFLLRSVVRNYSKISYRIRKITQIIFLFVHSSHFLLWLIQFDT